MLITPALKDKILKELVSTGNINFSANINRFSKETGIDTSVMEAILDYFKKSGFLDMQKNLGGNIYFTMKVPAYDFYSRGGFVGQEELLTKNIQKLLLEIESLKPSMPDRIVTLTSIASNITTALSLFLTR